MKTDDVKRILVVGAGQMGAQIAMQSALHGYALTLNDLSMDLLQKGMAGNRKQLERRVQKGQMTKDQMEEAIARVRLEPDLAKAAHDADFVIEAIVERLEPKRECFAKLDRFCPPHAILATNSSTLMNSQIASATKRPDKCANMHYFYPPLVMKLVEVVKGQATSEESLVARNRCLRRPRAPHPSREKNSQRHVLDPGSWPFGNLNQAAKQAFCLLGLASRQIDGRKLRLGSIKIRIATLYRGENVQRSLCFGQGLLK